MNHKAYGGPFDDSLYECLLLACQLANILDSDIQCGELNTDTQEGRDGLEERRRGIRLLWNGLMLCAERAKRLGV